MFTAVLFTIAKRERQPKCTLMNEWVKENRGLGIQWSILRHKKEGNPAICDVTNKFGEHYAKWNKPGIERQILHDLIYIWNPKIVRLIKPEKRMLVAMGWQVGGGKNEMLVKEYSFSCAKWMSSADLTYSLVTIVNTVLYAWKVLRK